MVPFYSYNNWDIQTLLGNIQIEAEKETFPVSAEYLIHRIMSALQRRLYRPVYLYFEVMFLTNKKT